MSLKKGIIHGKEKRKLRSHNETWWWFYFHSRPAHFNAFRRGLPTLMRLREHYGKHEYGRLAWDKRAYY